MVKKLTENVQDVWIGSYNGQPDEVSYVCACWLLVQCEHGQKSQG